MEREFTEEKYNELKQYLPEKNDDLCDFIRNLSVPNSSLLETSSINDCLNNAETYNNTIFDHYHTTAAELRTIFSSCCDLDDTYGILMQDYLERINLFKQYIDKMADVMSKKPVNLSPSKVKSQFLDLNKKHQKYTNDPNTYSNNQKMIGNVRADNGMTIKVNAVYYCQSDPEWKNIMYSSVNDIKQTIGSSGCGPTSMAMVITSLTDYTVTPVDMSNFSLNNGYRTEGTGTDWDFFSAAANEYDLDVIKTDDYSAVKDALNDGDCMVIASMGDGHFTQNGHFVVLAGICEVNGVEMFIILDPNDNNGNWGDDDSIIRTDNSGIVLANADMVNKEHQEYFIIRKK